jgi:ribosome-binding protein aMBF1 (putative translation factor)
MMNSSVKAVCKHCGKQADANSFILDIEYKMMVCAQCVKERKNPKLENKDAKEKETAKSVKLPKAPGWDAEDEYLEKMQPLKAKQKVTVQKIDDEFVRYQCPHCKYTFKYSIVRQKPGNCPYCSSSIERMQF